MRVVLFGSLLHLHNAVVLILKKISVENKTLFTCIGVMLLLYVMFGRICYTMLDNVSLLIFCLSPLFCYPILKHIVLEENIYG